MRGGMIDRCCLFQSFEDGDGFLKMFSVPISFGRGCSFEL